MLSGDVGHHANAVNAGVRIPCRNGLHPLNYIPDGDVFDVGKLVAQGVADHESAYGGHSPSVQVSQGVNRVVVGTYRHDRRLGEITCAETGKHAAFFTCVNGRHDINLARLEAFHQLGPGHPRHKLNTQTKLLGYQRGQVNRVAFGLAMLREIERRPVHLVGHPQDGVIRDPILLAGTELNGASTSHFECCKSQDGHERDQATMGRCADHGLSPCPPSLGKRFRSVTTFRPAWRRYETRSMTLRTR